MPKIYLSPSMRRQNKCVCGDNELLHSREYAGYMARFLEESGADVRINSGSSCFGVRESNIWKADIYYSVRTSASGAKSGSVLYIGKNKNLSEAYRCAALIKKRRKDIYNGYVGINVVKRFYETVEANSLCICDEIINHNNMKDATFFHKNIKEMAQHTAHGLLDYFDYIESHIKNDDHEKPVYKPLESSEESFKTCLNICRNCKQYYKDDCICECCADEYSNGIALNAPSFSNEDFKDYLIDEEEELISGIGPFPEDNGKYISILP